MLTAKQLIIPEWPAPKSVHAYSTTRQGGYSNPPFEYFNLHFKTGEQPEIITKNRRLLKTTLNLPSEPTWLTQPHGNLVVDAAKPATLDADGSYYAVENSDNNPVCIVTTADCLPILLCNQAGTEIAALHAGWRSLAEGIIENGLAKFNSTPNEILAWLGPAISQKHFAVGTEVRDKFIEHDPNAATAFKPTAVNKWLADLYQLAQQRLAARGITKIYGGNFCTYTDKNRFYSYRRNNQTGRMASLIWIE